MPFKGHTWMICRRLKVEQKKKIVVQKGKKKEESAHVTTDQSLSQTPVILNPTVFPVFQSPVVQNQAHVSTNPNKRCSIWKFDTCTSAHMTLNIELFEVIQKDHRTVKVGGNHLLEYEGKSTCILHPLLPDGTSTIVRLMNVLYVPQLGYNLLSWNCLRSSFVCIITGKDVFVLKNNICILWGEFTQNLPYLHELIQYAHATIIEPAQAELDGNITTTKPARSEVDCDPITIELTRVDYVMSNTVSVLTEPPLAEPINRCKPDNRCKPVNRHKKQTSSKPTSKSFEHWHAAFGHINSSVC